MACARGTRLSDPHGGFPSLTYPPARSHRAHRPPPPPRHPPHTPTYSPTHSCDNYESRCAAVAKVSKKPVRGKKVVRNQKVLSKAAIDVRARINSKKASVAKKDMPMDMYYGTAMPMDGTYGMPPTDGTYGMPPKMPEPDMTYGGDMPPMDTAYGAPVASGAVRATSICR